MWLSRSAGGKLEANGADIVQANSIYIVHYSRFCGLHHIDLGHGL